MKSIRSPFFSFRYLVSPASNQTTIVHELNKSKEKLMLDIFDSINETAKSEWTKGQKRYLFYGFQKRDHLFIIKFAKETNESIYVEGDTDIEVKGIKETKFVYLIVDTIHQIILIERNSSIFSGVDYAIEVIEDFLRFRMRPYDYVVNIYPLVSPKKFWNYVDKAEQIYELTLVLNAPNMPFFGNKDTREILQRIKETTNNEVFTASFKNKEGKLKVLKDTMGSWVDYIIEVGGRYSLRFKKDGIEDVKTSENDTEKIFIVRHKTDKYSDDELENIETKIEYIHTLEKRDAKI